MQTSDVSRSTGVARDLVVFTTSPRPDPYANSLAFLLRAGGLHRVTFINIEDPADPPTAPAGEVVQAVRALIQSLAAGKYPALSGDVLVDEEVAACYQEMMRELNAVAVESATWARDSLSDRLRSTVAARTIFDVTALRKDLLADVVILLISMGHPLAYTFELKTAPKFDQRDLYYMLAARDFSYSNLLAGKNVEGALKKAATARQNRRRLLIVSAAILPVIVAVNLVWPESVLSASLNWIAGAASIVSWLAYFVVQDHST